MVNSKAILLQACPEVNPEFFSTLLIWIKQIAGTLFDAVIAVSADALGNVYATGVFDGETDFDPGIGNYTLTAGNRDCFVVRLDSAGSFEWVGSLGGPGNCNARGIAFDGSGSAYSIGVFGQGSIDFDPGVRVLRSTPDNTHLDSCRNSMRSVSSNGLEPSGHQSCPTIPLILQLLEALPSSSSMSIQRGTSRVKLILTLVKAPPR